MKKVLFATAALFLATPVLAQPTATCDSATLNRQTGQTTETFTVTCQGDLYVNGQLVQVKGGNPNRYASADGSTQIACTGSAQQVTINNTYFGGVAFSPGQASCSGYLCDYYGCTQVAPVKVNLQPVH